MTLCCIIPDECEGDFSAPPSAPVEMTLHCVIPDECEESPSERVAIYFFFSLGRTPRMVADGTDACYFFFSLGRTPRMVADGTDACFMKALGLMPTMCLNCLEK